MKKNDENDEKTEDPFFETMIDLTDYELYQLYEGKKQVFEGEKKDRINEQRDNVKNIHCMIG